jgi:protein-disulfide isomerase
MISLRHLTAVVLACLAIGMAAPAAAQGFSDAQRSEVERIIRDYLMRHPEVLQEAIAELEKRQLAADTERHKVAVKENRQLLFSSPRQVTVGNLQGDVTLVEFFDYNCGYCKRALQDLLNLMKADPKLKVVLKEFPVLGPASIEAAQVGAAVRMQDRGGKKYLEFHQKLLSGRGQVDRARAVAVAKEVGLDVVRLEKDMASDEVRATLEESMQLADKLGLNGTPSYVIGPDVVVGAVGYDALKEKVEAARACAAAATC